MAHQLSISIGLKIRSKQSAVAHIRGTCGGAVVRRDCEKLLAWQVELGCRVVRVLGATKYF